MSPNHLSRANFSKFPQNVVKSPAIFSKTSLLTQVAHAQPAAGPHRGRRHVSATADGPLRLARQAAVGYLTELKGSIGEGPNHSNNFEPFEPFEFFQNKNFPEFFLRKFKNFRKFQHFLTYRRNSDKISSKSEQKSVKRIQK